MNTLLQTPSLLLLITISIPLIGATIIALLNKQPNKRDISMIITAIVTFLCVQQIYTLHQNERIIAETLLYISTDLSISFSVEPLGLIFALIASFLWVITSIYATGYMRGNKEPHQTRFYICFALAITSALGIAFADNLITLFIFYEIMTLCTYPLVTHHGNEEAKQGGRTYLGILMGSSILFLLPAILWTWHISGTLTFNPSGIIPLTTNPTSVAILFALFMYGVGKAALMPLHRWLPAAMVAPTPVSALLHAVAVVKAGVFSIVKIILYVFGTDTLVQFGQSNVWAGGGWLTYVAGATILLASIVALKQDNLKKRLAYSTISQLSYIIMAISLLTGKAIVAAAFHIAAHAFSKITLFFAAGSIYTASKRKYVSELDGIGKRMPITMVAFTIGALSMIGIPPTVGFISKWYMLQGAFNVESYFVIAVLIISTVLNALYFLPIIYSAFFKPEVPRKDNKTPNNGEAPNSILIAITLTSIITIILFIEPEIFLDLAKQLITPPTAIEVIHE